jgi:hypothetical protein
MFDFSRYFYQDNEMHVLKTCKLLRTANLAADRPFICLKMLHRIDVTKVCEINRPTHWCVFPVTNQLQRCPFTLDQSSS